MASVVGMLGGCVSNAMNNDGGNGETKRAKGERETGETKRTNVDRGTGKEKRTKDRSYDVSTETVLAVHNRNGPVNVRPHDGSTVDMHAEIRANSNESLHEVSVTATNTENELRIVTEFDEGVKRDQASVSMDVRCPRNMVTDAVTTTNGSIEATDLVGDIEYRSRNGNLVVEDIEGTVSLTTSNGGITAKNVGGVAGAETSNGTIDVEIPSVPNDVTVENSNGPIDVALAPGLSVELSAETSNGPVSVHDIDVSSVEKSEHGFSGTLNEGRHSLVFETSNGSIDISSLNGDGGN
ncbi:DUF4097 family beta strand repeat-containing protein [Haladaptatus sp. CMAA 1911]|uniref:DUF4097 family beta strand repeat-containing protein n=1 Tax=unclassified Haladaptatus TaxID=2622732 RepID=UPI0037542D13